MHAVKVIDGKPIHSAHVIHQKNAAQATFGSQIQNSVYAILNFTAAQQTAIVKEIWDVNMNAVQMTGIAIASQISIVA